ncbi:hypothetical protein T265_01774 [Opisthorchis viverrini]|uniref:Transferrin-like domain-containing protein n=1 Tax=Opisthorchis viverrini TaxID=6198 RepID=A0A075AIS8_OPIVI|nr:hypothetical protein T265_01774 [Opisthorchis viverrini]KER32159.1 hypothetical protein T265_01774 [Opisthorchis viverrini]
MLLPCMRKKTRRHHKRRCQTFLQLHHEKLAKKAFTVLGVIRRTFCRITRMDLQILYEAYATPLLEYVAQFFYVGCKKDATLIGRVRRDATKMVVGLKYLHYETHLVVLDLFLLEYRCHRGDLLPTLPRLNKAWLTVVAAWNTLSPTVVHAPSRAQMKALLDTYLCVNVRWCVYTEPEIRKCEKLRQSITTIPQLSMMYTLTCIAGQDEFQCMRLIHSREADLINLDAGLAYYGSSLYSLRPIAVENYALDNSPGVRELFYYANVVVPKHLNPVPTNLRGKDICSAGAGTAEGWVMPFGKLFADLRTIPVTQCNSVVRNLIGYLGDSCIPNSLSEVFNPFGDNTQEVCQLCANRGLETWCTTRDRYARNHGALRCLREYTENIESLVKPTAAFVRAREIELASVDGFPMADYKLLCPTIQADGTWTADFNASTTTCHWGQIPARMIMTILTEPNVTEFNNFLTTLVQYFGPSGSHLQTFSLFQSTGYGNPDEPGQTYDLMFSDFTRNIFVPPEEETATYYRWISPNFLDELQKLEQCPLPTMNWCVIDQFEMAKCGRMKSAFAARRIQPDLNCIQADSAIDCMRLIQEGYADMITLEAGDLYAAGKYFDLVPIVAENYGDGPFYHAVAVVKKVNPGLLVSNWRHRFTCHSGVGKATGWIVPINLVLDTRQVIVLNGHLLYAFAELISRACVPGILNAPFDRTGKNNLNLCERCTGGNKDLCRRDHQELYYGDAGAFRCMTEGGDIAFTRHTTVHMNTAGRNPDYWARNLREDDYELLCADGRRANIDQWATCNLARIPSSVVVTASYKSENERTNMWRLLQYGQEYYSADKNPIFQMFDSGFGQTDLIFSDDTESLSLIPWENQTYTRWLGQRFLQLVENLEVTANLYEAGLYSAKGRLQLSRLTILTATIFGILTFVG